MERQNPAEPVNSNSSNPQKEEEEKEDFVNLKLVLKALSVWLGSLVALFLVLNYFNIVSLSKVYPLPFGFLPHKPFVQKEVKVIITPPPKSVDISQGQFESCSIKKEGNPLVEDVRSLPDGTIIGVLRGNIDSISFNMGKKSGAISLISIRGGQSHEFKRVEDEEGLVYDAMLQKEIKLSDLKRGMTVQISFNCFPNQDELFKITRIAVIGKM